MGAAKGASIGFPRLLDATPIERFAAELVQAEGVVLLPGSAYQHPGNHFRLGFGRRDIPQALGRLEHFAGRLPASARPAPGDAR